MDLRGFAGDLPAALADAVKTAKQKLADDRTEIATRKASEAAIAVLAPAVPELVTGSADLTGSNNTKVAATPAISPGNYAGRFVHWGIREHGMAAAINGDTAGSGCFSTVFGAASFAAERALPSAVFFAGGFAASTGVDSDFFVLRVAVDAASFFTRPDLLVEALSAEVFLSLLRRLRGADDSDSRSSVMCSPVQGCLAS